MNTWCHIIAVSIVTAPDLWGGILQSMYVVNMIPGLRPKFFNTIWNCVTKSDVHVYTYICIRHVD